MNKNSSKQILCVKSPYSLKTRRGYYRLKPFYPSDYPCPHCGRKLGRTGTKTVLPVTLELLDLIQLKAKTLHLDRTDAAAGLLLPASLCRLDLFRVSNLTDLNLEMAPNLKNLIIDQCSSIVNIGKSATLTNLRVLDTQLGSVDELPQLQRLSYLNGRYSTEHSVSWHSAGYPNLTRLLVDDRQLATLPHGPNVKRWCITADDALNQRLACQCEEETCPFTSHWTPRVVMRESSGTQYSRDAPLWVSDVVGYAGRARPEKVPTCGYLALRLELD